MKAWFGALMTWLASFQREGFVTGMAHAMSAYGVLLTGGLVGGHYGYRVDTAIVGGLGVMGLVALKEFLFDRHFEGPAATAARESSHFWQYLAGVVGAEIALFAGL